MVLLTLIISLLVIFTAVYFYIKRIYSFWERQGVPTIKPTFPYGNLENLGKKHNHSEVMQVIYQKLKGIYPFCGIYLFSTPVALVLDADLVKRILIEDFPYISDRGFFYNEKDDPISAHLFSTEGTKWKRLRKRMSPTFTSGKMKYMHPIIVDVADKFNKAVYADIGQDESKEIEMKDWLSRFFTDVIGICAYGIECNSLNNPNAVFRTIGRKVLDEPRHYPLVFFLFNSFKKISKYFGCKTTHEDVEKFFLSIVRETIAFRKSNNIKRNDFIDQLLEINNEHQSEEVPLTVNEIAAQVYGFYIGGIESSSTTLSFTLYELANNSFIQTKAREEIKTVLKKYDGKFTYEAMLNMTYVEQIINESLRKYPPVGILFREVVKDYKVPGTNHTLDKGSLVWIPTYAFHHDADYFPNPEKFDPDRFTEENVENRNKMVYFPFGDGPRACIANRFGLMQSKIGLVTMLLNYEFSCCPKTQGKLLLSKKSQFNTPASGVWLKVKKLNYSR